MMRLRLRRTIFHELDFCRSVVYLPVGSEGDAIGLQRLKDTNDYKILVRFDNVLYGEAVEGDLQLMSKDHRQFFFGNYTTRAGECTLLVEAEVLEAVPED